ncbi:zinc finger protein 346 isoform X1 [Colius striatus]|uniref:zinc finger protein 346 isoform X1 n=1 Tax=Colius striatus TaxID=57412 RepID=UPI002B1DEDAA|nr:zinc finger protein 346 isoform X1 [Colius striatus]
MADGAGSNGDAAGLPVGKEAVERLIRENGHIFTEAQCKVCSALLISESQRLAHYQSKKHANKVRRYLSIHGAEELAHGKKMKLDAKQDSKQEGSNGEDRNKCCPICNMTFSSPAVATSHYLGKTHAKNMKQQSLKVEEAVPPQKHPTALPTSTVSSGEENKDITDPDKFCSLCHATFNNPLMAKQHYVGKKHRKQETKHKLMAHYGRTPDAPASSFMGCQEQCRLSDRSRHSSMSGKSQLLQEATVISAKISRASCSTVLGVVGGPRTHILCQPTMVSLSLWISKALPSCMRPLS